MLISPRIILNACYIILQSVLFLSILAIINIVAILSVVHYLINTRCTCNRTTILSCISHYYFNYFNCQIKWIHSIRRNNNNYAVPSMNFLSSAQICLARGKTNNKKKKFSRTHQAGNIRGASPSFDIKARLYGGVVIRLRKLSAEATGSYWNFIERQSSTSTATIDLRQRRYLENICNYCSIA